MTGLTLALVYDLRSEYLARGYSEEAVAEFDSEETIDLLAAALTRLGHRIVRVGNGRALARCLADGARYDLVFSIAEGLGGRAREAQVPALCELYEQAYVFSDPTTLAVSLDKGIAKRVVRDAGVPTAPFAVVASGEDVPAIGFDLPVFVKPLAEGTGKGCELASVCNDRGALEAAVAELQRRFGQSVLIEPFLPGREFTVAIVDRAGGPEVVGLLEIVVNESDQHAVYSYTNKEACETRVSYFTADDEVAQAASTVALDAYRALQCRDAGRIDVRCDANGVPCFLEANPLAGLHPRHSDLPMAASRAGHSYDWLLNAIVTSAARRYGLDTARGRHRPPTKAFVPVLHAATAGRPDEADTLETAQHVQAALERLGYAAELVRFVPESGSITELARREPACVFNLVEAVDGIAAACLLAPWYLSRAGLRFTGNSFEAFVATASKPGAKGLLLAAGIPTPRTIGNTESFPAKVILKPEWEHGSLGIDHASVVAGTSMQRERREREATFKTRFFAEAYIAGREFNVAVIDDGNGAYVLPIQETLFVDWPDDRARIVDFEAKWRPACAAYVNTPRRFGIESTEPLLAAALGEYARAVWQVFGLGGYARIDFRVDTNDQPFVIDINANPGLGTDAGFVAAAAQAALDFEALTELLLRSAGTGVAYTPVTQRHTG